MKVFQWQVKHGFIFALAFIACLAFAQEDLPNQKNELEVHSILSQPDFQELVAQSNSRRRKKSNRRRNRQEVINSWRPFGIKNRYIEPVQSYFFNVDVGIGFLYFSDITSDLQLTFFQSLGATTNRDNTGQLQGKLGYNRTPAIEASLGVNILPWLRCSLDYAHQGGVQIQSHRQVQVIGNPIPGISGAVLVYLFESTLSLDAILAKVYFNLPCSLVWKTIAYNPYLGAAVGPGWQTWAHNRVINEPQSTPLLRDLQFVHVLKQKISANAVWMIDLGTSLRSVIPNLSFSVRMGTKFIGWGQARQIGLLEQQKGVVNYGLIRPFKVKFVYSFVPYLGVQWNF